MYFLLNIIYTVYYCISDKGKDYVFLIICTIILRNENYF